MVRKDLDSFLLTIPKEVTVVAATKYIDADDMLELYHHGINNFGENRIDSFLKKYEALSSYQDIKWHFIGHLQRNKAKLIINKIDCLHSLDSFELAELINKYREKPLDVFIEVSINLEKNKNVVPYFDVKEFINNINIFYVFNSIFLDILIFR